MKILLVSDSCTDDLVHGISRAGQQVEISSYEHAPARLNSCRTDMIILDCGINMIKGLKRLKKLKLDWPRIPVIFVSAISSEDSIIEAFRLGVKDFFKKPVNMFQLRDTIAAIGKSRNHSHERRVPWAFARSKSIAYMPIHYGIGGVSLPNNLLRSVMYVEENLAKEIFLENFAKKAGMSKYHFCRTFKKHLNMSPMQFLLHVRLDRAKLLLENSRHSVTLIASEVGFNDLSNFIKCFKKIYGVSPAVYRKKTLLAMAENSNFAGEHRNSK